VSRLKEEKKKKKPPPPPPPPLELFKCLLESAPLKEEKRRPAQRTQKTLLS